MSLVFVFIDEVNKLKKKLSNRMLQLVLKDMEEALKSNLRREGDIAWKVSYEVYRSPDSLQWRECFKRPRQVKTDIRELPG